MLELVNKDKIIYYSNDDKNDRYIDITNNKPITSGYEYDIKKYANKTILQGKSIINYYSYFKGDTRLFDKLQFCIKSFVSS